MLQDAPSSWLLQSVRKPRRCWWNELLHLEATCGLGSYLPTHPWTVLLSRRGAVSWCAVVWCGAVAELAVFMVPVNAMTYLPNLFFGSLVMWIGQDILKVCFSYPVESQCGMHTYCHTGIVALDHQRAPEQ